MEVWNVHFAKLKVCCIKFHHGTWGTLRSYSSFAKPILACP